MDIMEEYRKAGEKHGHLCPGLAIGVRAASIAIEKLEISDLNNGCNFCMPECEGCFIDGIKSVLNVSQEQGTLIQHTTGTPVFNFYNLANGKSVRLRIRARDLTDKEKAIREILTLAPEEVFDEEPVELDLPL